MAKEEIKEGRKGGSKRREKEGAKKEVSERRE